MQSVVIIGTGGTIAGAAARPQSLTGYVAGVLSPEQLVAALPPLAGQPIRTEALAQLDSCDMDHATWAALARSAARHLAAADVAAVVVTHGTDTLEETAYFLHRTVAAAGKPLVLTAAMRPATAPSPDGPQNLLDAVTLATTPGARGVMVAVGSQVFAGSDLRKVHGWRIDAFDGGDAGPLGVVEDGVVRMFRPWPAARLHAADVQTADPAWWPVVDIVTSHAGARAAAIDALVSAGARGIVIAGTGNGSVHAALLAAAVRAQAAGVRVLRSSRCQLGGVVGIDEAAALPSAGVLTPVQARIELLLDLLAAR